MRIAVLNLQFGVGTTKGYWQYVTSAWKYTLPHSDKPLEDAGFLLKDESVDIAICTEIADSSLRAGFVSQTKKLQESSGMSYGQFFAAVPGKLWDEGNALISRHYIVSTKTHALSGGSVPRIVSEVVLSIDGEDITVFVAHLALGKKARHLQMEELADIVGRATGPIVLGGDFNERNSTVLDTYFHDIHPQQCDTPTFPSWKPKNALQRVLLSKEFIVERTYVPLSPQFSDHAVLVVEARL